MSIESVSAASTDINEERVEQLRQLFPEVFSEGKIDFDKLRETLGDEVDDSPERYSFTWAGKRDAIRLLQAPTRATLAPARDESIEFDETNHVFIEGENLEVLKLLYKAYFGKVKMIYIDPPYNTGKDFIYPDNFTDPLDSYLQLTGQKDAAGNILASNTDSSGRYHSAWLTMIYPRLFIARQLLRDDGVIFVSVDDHEAHNLMVLMNEIFGEEQFVANIAVVNNLKGRSDRKSIATAHESLLMYAKPDFISYGLSLDDDDLENFNQRDEKGRRFQWRDLRKRGGPDRRVDRPNLYFPLYLNEESGLLSLERTVKRDVEIFPLKSNGTDGRWRWGKEKVATEVDTMKASYVARRDAWNVSYRIYLEIDGERRTRKPKSVWIGSQYSTDLAQRRFKSLFPGLNIDFTPKAVDFLKEIVQQSADESDLCLDFFAGSGTLAQAIIELNREDDSKRNYILVQLPEKIPNNEFDTLADLAKERIRRSATKLIRDEDGKLPLASSNGAEDLGFRVFQLSESNMRGWTGTADATPDEAVAQMEVFSDPLKDGWDAEDVVWEVAIKEGFPLNSRTTQANVGGQTVFRVHNADEEQAFHICLDEQVPADLPRRLGLSVDDLFVCRDRALDDTTAANLALACRLKVI